MTQEHNGLTHESNFISLIGNDPITIYGGKNHWNYKVSAPWPGLDEGPPVTDHASGLTPTSLKVGEEAKGGG